MLISILLRVTEFLFNSEYLMTSRNDPTTSSLIKLATEVLVYFNYLLILNLKIKTYLNSKTVLLAIIKSSFSYNLNHELWDQLMNLLSSASSNPDVIDKWIVSFEKIDH